MVDAFYCMNLNPDDSIRLGVLFPTRKGERKLIVIPLILPMGWSESPPAFCTGTETVVDLANTTLASDMPSLLVPHRLDSVSETTAKIPIVTSIPTEQASEKPTYGVVISSSPSQVGSLNPIRDKTTGKLLEVPNPVQGSNPTKV